MKENYTLQHRLALDNPYGSVVRVFRPQEDKILVGIKNTATIPNTLMKKLEKTGFALHTIDKKSRLAGRAVDTELINPITGRWMSGSSSGTAVNVFAGINDLGIGNDGGGSVLAPAISVNILGFISRLIEEERIQRTKPNTDGIVAGNSIGFMARRRDILYKAIEDSIGVKPAEKAGRIISDRKYEGIISEVVEVMDPLAPRNELYPYLKQKLSECDVMIVTEGPIDLEGFGDSLFGHFDERTRAIQNASRKGYVRVCNIAQATALAIPREGYGMSVLLMCESKKEKVARLLKAAEAFPDVNDELIERYFLDLNNYYMDEYEV